MSEYSNSLVKPNNRYNTLSTYNSRPTGTVQGLHLHPILLLGMYK